MHYTFSHYPLYLITIVIILSSIFSLFLLFSVPSPFFCSPHPSAINLQSLPSFSFYSPLHSSPLRFLLLHLIHSSYSTSSIPLTPRHPPSSFSCFFPSGSSPASVYLPCGSLLITIDLLFLVHFLLLNTLSTFLPTLPPPPPLLLLLSSCVSFSTSSLFCS